MSNVELYTDRAPVLAADIAVQRLGEWAQSAEAASHVASQLVQTSFVPAAFRGKPYEATAAILAGLEVGLSPMASLRSFDVIQGQAAPRALTLRAVVQSHGHEMELVEATATRCVMKGRRRGASEWQKVTWTIDRAQQLKLTGKDNWKNQPQAMLMARATSELARLIAADAILGIGYSSEEIADGAGAGVEVVADVQQAATSGTRRMSRRKSEPVQATHEPDPPPEPEQEDKPTDAQTKKVMALFKEHGITDRDERLCLTSTYAGRDVASWSELTKAEASHVIDQLQALEPAADDVTDAELVDDPELFEGTSDE